ncbi:hypothetical protein QWZ10_20060 [Paracoccus cavernae]|uniref:Uncharacterized protein n=1 Tax=Paracoccus cavernae TaxID=1571207 RepID=A0ABT8D9K2_9RHOB|nr:hypothetical protein [Paracoccus cavernae]
MDIIKAALLPHLQEIIGILLASLIGWAANTARRKWGIDIEAKHLSALQSALMTGARLALDRNLDGKAALAVIMGHVQLSVPDAVIGLKADQEVLTNLAQASLSKVTKEAASAVQGAGAAISAMVQAEVAKALPAAAQVTMSQGSKLNAPRR